MEPPDILSLTVGEDAVVLPSGLYYWCKLRREDPYAVELSLSIPLPHTSYFFSSIRYRRLLGPSKFASVEVTSTLPPSLSSVSGAVFADSVSAPRDFSALLSSCKIRFQVSPANEISISFLPSCNSDRSLSRCLDGNDKGYSNSRGLSFPRGRFTSAHPFLNLRKNRFHGEQK